MTNREDPPAGTDWQAIVSWTLIPLTIAAGFVYAALTPDWDDLAWARGLLALIPLEYFRAFVFSILSDTYRDYRSPRHAVGVFLISLAILIAIAAAISIYVVGFRDWLDWIRDPQVYEAVAFALAIIALDGVIGVYFFRGDAPRLAARLQAVGDDARDWLQLAAFQLPVVLAGAYGILLLMREARGYVPWVPNPDSPVMRSICLMYAAFYFVGKAVFLAHANTQAFNRTGKRLFGTPWVQWLIWEKNRNAELDARNERAAERRRASILGGETPEP